MMQEQAAPTDTGTSAPPQADEGMQESQGIDAIIARVDGYIQDPKSITPETLQELRMELEDLKTILEPESTEQDMSGAPEGGLVGMMGRGR